MKVLVIGSAHLGEGLVRTLRHSRHRVVGVDIAASPFTDTVGSIVDADVVEACMQGIEAVIHAATLHKPHVATHGRQQFVDTNATGTLNVLEAAARARVRSFVFTSTTSAFRGRAVAAAGRPGGVDHRRRRADSQEHLRRDEDRSRRPVPALPTEPRAAVRGAQDVPLLR